LSTTYFYTYKIIYFDIDYKIIWGIIYFSSENLFLNKTGLHYFPLKASKKNNATAKPTNPEQLNLPCLPIQTKQECLHFSWKNVYFTIEIISTKIN